VVLERGAAGNKVAVVLGQWWLRPFEGVVLAKGQLFPWIPLLIGCGVAIWFALPFEPQPLAYVLGVGLCALCLVVRLRGAEHWHPFAIALACLVAGGLACGARVVVVKAPMVDFRYYGPVTGRVVEIDRSQSDALRVTLDQVILDRVDPDRTPERVRLSLRGKEAGHSPSPGEVILLTGHLSAPQGPVEPGAFNFRRMAFFDQLGAVGYSTAPVMLWHGAEPGARLIDRLRSHLSTAMMRAMPSQAGAYAAGAMTGDRSGITQDTVQALRDSSLAHLLAISGMNLAFLIAFVFGLIRYGLALIPPIALRVNTKKVAAVVSLGVAAFYLALSGANVATERAFIMVSVMLGAVLLDRKALTLRSVAIAGVILLLWKPESLLEPGFQMSFAATVALIAGFRAVDRRVVKGALPNWAIPVFTLVLSSLIGGLSTAPYAAAHFNRFTDYGLIANLLTVPVMGAVVMPAGAIAALLAPFGLAALPLWFMEKGSAWILLIAHWVAGWEGSVTPIPAPGPWVLPLITLAGAWVILAHGRARALALAPALAALVLWVGTERPLVLISEDGALVGVMGPEGRAVSAPRGAGFSARSWLENDGDLAPQPQAATRVGFQGEQGQRRFAIAGLTGIALKGRGSEGRIATACASADIVVASVVAEDPPANCLLFDQKLLRQTGAVALLADPQGLRVWTTRQENRVWSAPLPDVALPRVIRRNPARLAALAPATTRQ